jgi:xylan 1,4-beta-xylosidase
MPQLPARGKVFAIALAAAALGAVPVTAAVAADPAGDAAWEQLDVNAAAPGTPLPHFWEQMFGSGRAILALRDGYRQDLRAVEAATGFRYLRFHAIFDDDVGIVTRDARGRPRYNFSYVDQIYDGLLANGVRPFVEIGFMPTALTSNRRHVMSFWYRPNVAPPRRYSEWDALVRRFAAHLVERFGADEVAQWYFEVWNEPNIDFWQGRPKRQSYFELYAHTARDIKSVDPRLRVGGPATAQAAWIEPFLRYTQGHGLPVDFVSSHVYANDTAKAVFGTDGAIPRDRMVCRAVRKLHEQIARSPYPRLPLILSEYNASYKNEAAVTDSVFMGPWIADTIRQCAGLAPLMSYWTFSDVFEEQGVIRNPFYGGFGLVAERGIPKPAFNAFALLHRLGQERLAVESESALVTRRADGALVLALWNYRDPDAPRAPSGRATHPASAARSPTEPKRFRLRVAGIPAGSPYRLWRLDAGHGNVLPEYVAMGSPDFPNGEQIQRLQAAAQLPPPEDGELQAAMLELSVPSQGLILLELAPPPSVPMQPPPPP